MRIVVQQLNSAIYDFLLRWACVQFYHMISERNRFWNTLPRIPTTKIIVNCNVLFGLSFLTFLRHFFKNIWSFWFKKYLLRTKKKVSNVDNAQRHLYGILGVKIHYLKLQNNIRSSFAYLHQGSSARYLIYCLISLNPIWSQTKRLFSKN